MAKFFFFNALHLSCFLIHFRKEAITGLQQPDPILDRRLDAVLLD